MENTRQKNRLSDHFSLEELSYSRIAIENGIDNTPPAGVQKSLEHLVLYLLEPLRRLYGKPIAVTSGYRSEEVNRLAGGVCDSQHIKGEAADCYTPDIHRLLSVLCKSDLVFDQAIWYRRRNFLHLSLKLTGKNRMQILLYIFCLILLLPGCMVSRKRQKQDRVFRSDTVATSALQSSELKQSCYLSDSATWHICRIVYSPPDSLGRLFPETVTSLKMEHHRVLTDSCQLEQTSQNLFARQQTEISLAGSSSTPVHRNRYVFLFCGILFIVAILYFYNRKT